MPTTRNSTKTKTSRQIYEEILAKQNTAIEELGNISQAQQRQLTATKQSLDATLKGMKKAHKGTRNHVSVEADRIIASLSDKLTGFGYIGALVLAVILATVVWFVVYANKYSASITTFITLVFAVFAFFAIVGIVEIVKRFAKKRDYDDEEG